MGFKNKKKIGFTPLDLSVKNVDTIFKRCLADDNTKRVQRFNFIF